MSGSHRYVLHTVLCLLLGYVNPCHAAPPDAATPQEVVHSVDASGPAGQSAPKVAWLPLPAGDSLYAYCGGDPINRSDPSGLDWKWTNGDWQWIDGPGEIVTAQGRPEPPAWAKPINYPGERREGEILTTAGAVMWNFGTRIIAEERAARNLASAVGQGWQGTVVDAATLYRFAQEHEFADGIAAISAQRDWASEEQLRIAGKPVPQGQWTYTGPSPKTIYTESMRFVAESTPVYHLLNAAIQGNQGHGGAAMLALGGAVLAVLPVERVLAGVGRVLTPAIERIAIGGGDAIVRATVKEGVTYARGTYSAATKTLTVDYIEVEEAMRRSGAGGQLVEALVKNAGGEVRAISGVLVGTNGDVLRAGLSKGLSAVEAARLTPMGKWAESMGMRNIEMDLETMTFKALLP